jgi:hypothetical protein
MKAQQPGIVAHEWGTFTSIAGNAGKAVEWYPWAGPSDLPDFVEHFQSANFKPNLSGTIRMETPVLYFHSREEATVSVHVTFSKGLITEWYPHATSQAPDGRNFLNTALTRKQSDGSVRWSGVMLRPSGEGLLPHEAKDSRYYAARFTGSTLLSVPTAKGTESEKFLFYRGASSEESPVNAKVLADGNVAIANLTREPVAKLFWFERRGKAAGIRALAGFGEKAVMAAPELSGTGRDGRRRTAFGAPRARPLSRRSAGHAGDLERLVVRRGFKAALPRPAFLRESGAAVVHFTHPGRDDAGVCGKVRAGDGENGRSPSDRAGFRR